jgi:hypothetical protein
MKKLTLVLCIFMAMATFTIACSDDDHKEDEYPCVMVALPAVEVKVTNAVTGDILTEGVTVTATDGTHVATLVNRGGLFYFGAPAPGEALNYPVTVSAAKEGYATYTSEPFTVLSGPCGVGETKKITAVLVQMVD